MTEAVLGKHLKKVDVGRILLLCPFNFHELSTHCRAIERKERTFVRAQVAEEISPNNNAEMLRQWREGRKTYVALSKARDWFQRGQK